nr:MAG TPA: DNA methyltransferase [Caudoviricetes sp.]
MDGVTHEIGSWDMLIAHPPCTYLSNAGARHLWKGHQLQADRVMLGIQGRDLFMRFWWAEIPLICVENPVPSKVFSLPQYTQTIQPYQFGHPYTKKTCLWLKGLPLIKSTNSVKPVATWCPSGSYSHKHDKQYAGIFTTDRAKNRAKTFPGIARAMAEQWG